MTRYQYRRRITGDEWQDCTEADARNLLSQGYFDPDIPLGHLETGATIITSAHEVRINPTLLIVQRSEPQADQDGEVIYA